MGGRRNHSNKRKRTASTAAMPTTDTTNDAPSANTPTTGDGNLETPQVQEQPLVAEAVSTTPASSITVSRVVQGPPMKRTKREAYRASVKQEEEKVLAELPRKKFYRQRAHANPFSDHALEYPISPSQMDWSSQFPAYVTKAGDNPGQLTKTIDIADVGCGFGGLLFALAPKVPDSLILGLEIRVSVTEFVQNKIRALRHQVANPDAIPNPHPPSETTPFIIPPNTTYQNIAALRTNTMKFFPNFMPPRSLTSLFLCFPDPHFKARKHKARIVSSTLCAEYFYVVKPGGRVYTITDVEDLAKWMAEKFDAHPGFRRVQEAEWRGVAGQDDGDVQAVKAAEDGKDWGADHDWKARLMMDETEEGKKVTRNGGKKFVGIWERREAPAWPGEEGE